MTKATLTLLAAAGASLGITIYWEEQRISDLRGLVASVRKGGAELSAQTERDQDEIRRLNEQISGFKAESDQLREKLAAKNPEPAKGETAGATAPGTKEEAGKTSGSQTWMKGMAKMFTDPEMKKSMRVQQLMGIRMLYGDLAKELGLGPEETNQLMEILADRQMDISSNAMANLDGSKVDPTQNSQKIADTKKHYTEELQSILGPEKYKTLESYEGSVGDRFMLQQFEGQFSAAGAPLEAPQKEKLLGLMRDERAKMPSDPNDLMNSSNPQQQMESLKSDTAIDAFMAKQDRFNQRILDRSRDVLNADQVAALQKVQHQQLEMMKAQIKMSREFLGLGK